MPILRLVWNFQIAVAICNIPFFPNELMSLGTFHCLIPCRLLSVKWVMQPGMDGMEVGVLRVWGCGGVRGGGVRGESSGI